MNNKDILSIFFFILMLSFAIVIGFYYYVSEVNECTASPFVYGAKQMENKLLEGDFMGYGTFYFKDQLHNIPEVIFTSKNVSYRFRD